MIISILPGELMWNSRGTHALDENDIAIIATQQKNICVDDDVSQRVCATLTAARMKQTFHQLTIENSWIKYGNGISKMFTFLEHIEDDVFKVSENMIISGPVTYMLQTQIDWNNIPTKYKKKPKMLQKEIEVPEQVYVDETYVDCDFESGKAVYKKTGKTILVDKVVMLDIYDWNGKYMGQKEFTPKKKIKVEEMEIDENWNVVMENELDEGNYPLKVPIYETKILDDGSVAYLIPCYKVVWHNM
jgi:hypothetical protein